MENTGRMKTEPHVHTTVVELPAQVFYMYVRETKRKKRKRDRSREGEREREEVEAIEGRCVWVGVH